MFDPKYLKSTMLEKFSFRSYDSSYVWDTLYCWNKQSPCHQCSAESYIKSPHASPSVTVIDTIDQCRYLLTFLQQVHFPSTSPLSSSSLSLSATSIDFSRTSTSCCDITSPSVYFGCITPFSKVHPFPWSGLGTEAWQCVHTSRFQPDSYFGLWVVEGHGDMVAAKRGQSWWTWRVYYPFHHT